MLARSLKALVGVIIATCGVVSAQTCGSQQSAVSSLKQKIERDKRAIKGVGFNTDAAEFNSLAGASAEQQKQMKHTAYQNLVENLASAALSQIGEAASATLRPQASLPNGYASLNPFNVNTYIKGLDDPSGPVASLLRQVASTSNKAAKLNFLKSLPDAVEQEQATYDILFGDASTQPRSLEADLKLTQALAQLGGYAQAAQVLQIGTSGADVLVAYANLLYGNLGALKQLNKLSVANAKALVSYDSTMKQHIAALKAAEIALAQCTSPGGQTTQTPTTVPGDCKGLADSIESDQKAINQARGFLDLMSNTHDDAGVTNRTNALKIYQALLEKHEGELSECVAKH